MEIRRLLKAAETAYPGVDPGETRVLPFEDMQRCDLGRLRVACGRLLACRGAQLMGIGEIDAITPAAIHLRNQWCSHHLPPGEHTLTVSLNVLPDRRTVTVDGKPVSRDLQSRLPAGE